MRTLGRAAGLFALVTAIVVSVLATTPGTASACICNSDAELSDRSETVDVAFVGRPIFEILYDGGDYPDKVALGFEVETVYKGDVGPRIVLRSNTTTCGKFYRGHYAGEYSGAKSDLDDEPLEGIVAWEDRHGELSVGRCGSSVPIDELVEVFGVGYPPDDSIEFQMPDHDSTPVKGLIITPFAVAAGILIAYVLAKRGARRNPAPAESSPEGGS